jgi:hypothetical protein
VNGVMTENDSMNEGDRRSMMRSMMGKVTGDIDMKETMRNTMTGRSIVRVSHSS